MHRMATKGLGKRTSLRGAVAHHYGQMRILRESRDRYIAAAAGTLYPHQHNDLKALVDRDREVLNFMGLAAQAHAVAIAANRPRIYTVAEDPNLLNFSEKYARAINLYSKKLHLEETLQACAFNSFFMLGTCKVYMSESAAVYLEADEWMDPGQPFCQDISTHHLNYDTDASDFRQCSFIADRYRVRYRDLINDDRFPASVRREIETRGPQHNKTAQQEESLSPLMGGGGIRDEGVWEDYIYLADIFLPKDGLIHTYPVDEKFEFTSDEPLATVEYEGSETGPYFFLNMGPVPDKTTPSSPAQNLLLCHNMINTLYRKLEDQARDQKQIKIVPEGSPMATKVRDAENGEWIEGHAPDVTEVRFDGPDQNLFGFLLNAQNQFSQMDGNLFHKLGTAANADTATQQGMIGQAVSRVENHQQQRFVKFTRDIVTELGRLLFSDQTTEIKMNLPIEGNSGRQNVADNWGGARDEGNREGDWQDYGIDINPYSMAYKSPEQRLAELDARFNKYVQLLPLLQQQGKTLNFDEFLKLEAELSDLPEMRRLIVDLPPTPGEPGSMGQGAHERVAPDPNKGQYMHHSAGGANTGDPDAQAMAMMSSPEMTGA